MKRVIAFILFAVFTMGLIGCASEQSPASKDAESAPAANRSDTNTTANSPGATPQDEKGKSDADKTGSDN